MRDSEDCPGTPVPGTLLEDGSIACGAGSVVFLEVQPAGGRKMSFEAYRNGRSLAADARAEALS